MIFSKKEPPIIADYGGTKMLMVDKQTSLRGLENDVQTFLEAVTGTTTSGTPDNVEVPYTVYYFDGTELFSDSGPFKEAHKIVTAGIKKYIKEVEGENTMTSTFISPFGIVTLVGIKMPADGEMKNVMPTTGNC